MQNPRETARNAEDFCWDYVPGLLTSKGHARLVLGVNDKTLLPTLIPLQDVDGAEYIESDSDDEDYVETIGVKETIVSVTHPGTTALVWRF